MLRLTALSTSFALLVSCGAPEPRAVLPQPAPPVAESVAVPDASDGGAASAGAQRFVGDAGDTLAADSGSASQPAWVENGWPRDQIAKLDAVGEANGWRRVSLMPIARTWAAFLNAVHVRLHHEFSDKLLNRPDALPAKGDAGNESVARLRVLIVLDGRGNLVDVRVTEGSADARFDREAVSAIRAAAPFPPPPHECGAPDGNVYFGWILSSDPVYACNTLAAYPLQFATAKGR